jgi:ribonuclease D
LPEREVSYVWVDDPKGLRAAVTSISSSARLGVDTEADSRHHYPEKTCLIQVVADDRVFIIDPLVAIDIGELREVFESPRVEKIFHGADFDLRGLNRDWGFELQAVYDTNTGARFAGLDRFGYAALIEDLLGHVIAKDQRLQRSDWSKRPLPEAALEYAAADVIYLGEVRDAIDERVAKLGRSAWVAEELQRLEQIRYTPPDPDSAYLAVRGSHKLNGRGLAVLKALWILREGEARRLDRPTAFVISAEALVAIATEPEIDLAEVKGLGEQTRRRLGLAIARAVKEGLAAGPLKRPPGRTPFRPRPSASEAAVLARLKEWRVAEGEKLAMDPSLLWPMRSLERLARAPQTVDEELVSPDIRRWQRTQFEAAVRATLASFAP